MNYHLHIFVYSLLISIFCVSCSQNTDPELTDKNKSLYQMGELPPQTASLIEQEYQIYRKHHPEMDESTAKYQFDVIQTMSQTKQPGIAKWAERQALANAWIRKEIEDIYHPSTVSDAMIQSAIDAYAFQSGHPALVTVSHILIRHDNQTTPDERRKALNVIRTDIIHSGDLSDQNLRKAAERLTLAGYRSDMNDNLTFPRYAMKSFLGEQLHYQMVVEPFADASFKLSKENPVSPVTDTEFGSHLIFFRNIEPEKKADLSRDREFMRDSIVLFGRKLAAGQKIDALMQNAAIAVNQKKLSELAGANQSSFSSMQDASTSK